MQRRSVVFVVDDDPAALSSVGALLAAFDFDVRAFSSAEEFLASKVDVKRACLLCDVRLPGKNGLELQSILRSKGIALPVILVSGYADPDMVKEALENGASAVIEKPVDPNTLVQRIETAIQTHDTRDGTSFP